MLHEASRLGVLMNRRIGVEEGWRALFKGLGPTLVGIIPARYVTTLSLFLDTLCHAPWTVRHLCPQVMYHADTAEQ